MLSEEYLQLICDLTQKEKRRAAAKRVARLLGAADLMLFVRDPELYFFVPALGLEQSMPDMPSWQSFLTDCINLYSSTAYLPWHDSTTEDEIQIVTGIATQDNDFKDCVMVLLGKPHQSEMLSHLGKLLPLVASCIRFELMSMCAKNSAAVYGQEATQTAFLVAQLDQTRQDLQQSLYHSQQALNARNDFLSVASHELKTPLQSIILEVGFLKRSAEKAMDTDINQRSMERFRSLDTHLKRMTVLIDNLLDYSQVVEGKLIFKHQKVDLTELTQEVVQRFERQAKAVGSVISFNAEGTALVYCDRSKMDQVISNLISNAIKYGASNEIKIGIDSCRHRPSLFVQDHGIGIPVQDQKRIFERFERSISARNISGFGLGLFVVKQIIDGHGGTVEVQSEPNTGSKFTVYLPNHANYLELQ